MDTVTVTRLSTVLIGTRKYALCGKPEEQGTGVSAQAPHGCRKASFVPCRTNLQHEMSVATLIPIPPPTFDIDTLVFQFAWCDIEAGARAAQNGITDTTARKHSSTRISSPHPYCYFLFA